MSISKTTRRRLILAAKMLIFAIVIGGIVRAIMRAGEEYRSTDTEFRLADFGWGWFAIAAGSYALSMLPMAWFWYLLLRNMDQQVGRYETFRAYTIGHLGKYVPGKVMVIVLRAGLIRRHDVDRIIVAVTIFVETLTMMATGAFLAAVTLTVWSSDRRLQLLAVGLMLGTVFVTLPPILKLVIRKLKSNTAADQLDTILAKIDWKTIGAGWLASAVTWFLITASLWATAQGVPNTTELPTDLTTLAQLLSSVSLAVVAGFLSLIPGGVGVREWVLDQTLVPLIGTAAAIIVAIALRLIWLLTELVFSLILFVIPPRDAASLPPAND